MIIRELLAKLGIQLDKGSFTGADLALATTKAGLLALGGLAVAAAAGLGALVHDLIETTGELNDTSQAIGVSTDSLQELTYAAKQNSAGIEEVSTGLRLLSKHLYDASTGNVEAAQSFSRLHIKIRDGSGTLKKADALFAEIADKFKAMPDGAKKTALAMEVFGKSGARLIPTLNAGKAGLAELAAEAHAFGYILDKETIAAGDELGDNLDRLRAAAKGLGYAIAGPLLPQINDLVLAFIAWTKANKTLIAQRVDKVIKLLTVVGKAFVWVLNGIYKTLGFVIDQWQLLAVILASAVLTAITLNIGAIAALLLGYLRLGAAAVFTAARAALAWVAAAAGPIAIATLIAIAILLLDDLITYLQGGKSLIAELIPSWKALLESFTVNSSDDDPWWLTAMRGLVALVLHFPQIWQEVIDELKALLTSFADWITDVFGRIGKSITTPLANAFDYIKKALPTNFVHFGAASEAAGSRPSVSPSARPVAVSQTNTNDIKIYQTPGESSGDVASKVREAVDASYQTRLEEASVALGSP